MTGRAVPTTVWSRANRNRASRIAPRISSLARGSSSSAACWADFPWDIGQSSPGDGRTTIVAWGEASGPEAWAGLAAILREAGGWRQGETRADGGAHETAGAATRTRAQRMGC